MLWTVGNRRFDTLDRGGVKYADLLWTVGNRRFDTLCCNLPGGNILLWTVGNRRFDTLHRPVSRWLDGAFFQTVSQKSEICKGGSSVRCRFFPKNTSIFPNW